MTHTWRLEYHPNKSMLGIHVSFRLSSKFVFEDSDISEAQKQLLQLIRATEGVDDCRCFHPYSISFDVARAISAEVVALNVWESIRIWAVMQQIIFNDDETERGEDIDSRWTAEEKAARRTHEVREE